MARIAALASAACLANAISSDRSPDAAAPGPYECNMLTADPEVSCLLPFPSDFFNARWWNASAAPGLTLTPAAFPVTRDGNITDPAKGGFNHLAGPGLMMGPIMAYVPGLNLDLSGSPRLWNISLSTGPAATSVLLNAATGEAVDHWLELDHSGDDGAGTDYPRMLLLWPSKALDAGTSYVVAFRGLVDDSGAPIAPTDGFAALRDKTPTGNPALEASRPQYEGLFATLAAKGWARQTLTLAWSFTTNTKANTTDQFVSMRDDAFARVAQDGFEWKILEVTPPTPTMGKIINGVFRVPLYLSTPQPSLQSRLVLDPSTGLPVYQGWHDYEFMIIVPNSVLAKPAPSRVLQYGHGLFGSVSELKTAYLVNEANNHSYILGGVNWIGMDALDEPTIISMLLGFDGGYENFAMIPDRLHQGMLNFLLFMKFVTTSAFNKSPEVVVKGIPVISNKPGDWFYFGNSQGGIMGSVYMSVSTDVTRGVCGVPGGPYALLLPRSKDFNDLFTILKLRLPRSIDRIALIGLFQLLWDRMEPSVWTTYMNGGLDSTTPAHRSLFHYGLGDAQVSWLAAQNLARTVGAPFFEGQPLEGNQSLADFSFVPADTVLSEGSVVVGFDYGFPTVPFTNQAPNDGFDAHECPRRTPAAQAQMFHFFETGDIVNYCGSGGCHANSSVC